MTQTSSPFVAQVRFSSAEAARLSWRGQYFSVQGALVFPKKMTSLADVDAAFGSLEFALRLVPFKNQFRAKMLAALEEPGATTTETYGVTLRLDGKAGKLLKVDPLEQQDIAFEHGSYRPLNPGQERTVSLSEHEKAALEQSLDAFCKAQLLPFARDVFGAFYPELTDSWKTRSYQEFKRHGLYPFQAVFPSSLPIEKEDDGKSFLLEDHYTAKGDNWVVTCVIFLDDPESEQEVAWGGFRYDLATKKLKVMSEFPAKYNASEWFKQFDARSPFALDLLFDERAKFMRSAFARQLQAAPKA